MLGEPIEECGMFKGGDVGRHLAFSVPIGGAIETLPLHIGNGRIFRYVVFPFEDTEVASVNNDKSAILRRHHIIAVTILTMSVVRFSYGKRIHNLSLDFLENIHIRILLKS